MKNILPISLFGHAVTWIWLFLLSKNLHGELASAAYGQLSPATLYALIIVVGHTLAYIMIGKSPRAALALLITMIYSALVLLIIVIRLGSITYGNP